MLNKEIIKTNRTLSLPKIKISKQFHTQNLQKRFDNMYKKNWSLAPKCIIDGHEGNDILYICIKPQCSQITRLICEKCFYKNHQKHNDQFIAVDEIKKGNIEKLRFWPFQQKFRKIFQFITKHQSYVANMVQDVNATFNSMALRIINSIDQIRLSLLKQIDSFYIKETIKQQFSEQIKIQLKQSFQLEKLQDIVRRFFSKQIRHQVFTQQMKKLLNDSETKNKREKLLKYFNNSQKGKDMMFDKMHFLKKQNWIIQQINQQKSTLKQVQVTVDEAEIGIEKMIPQTMAYLARTADQYFPALTFQKKHLEDGSQYIGFMSKGSRVLIGMRTYKTGFVYYGQWKINSKNGWGVYQNKQVGYRYAGQWKEDKKSGYGRQSTVTYVYQGQYVNDKKQGFGVLIEDGMRFQIGWKGDKKHGQGKRIQKNGQQFQIYFLNGVESHMKNNKTNPAFDLKALSKRFSSTNAPQQNTLTKL